ILERPHILGVNLGIAAAHIELDAVVDQSLREWRGLDEKEPVVIARRELLADAVKKLVRRYDIDHRELSHFVGMIERHAMADPASAVMADQREFLEPEVLHH